MERNFCLYHGTIKKYADSITTSKEFKFQRRKDHWLGNGVYFFVDDFDQASIWANICRKNALKKQLENTEKVVFELNYTVDKADYLNLDSRTDRNKLDDFIVELQEMGTEINSADRHNAMCLILDFYVEYNGLKATKYTFSNEKNEGNLKPLGIENHGEQFCIYDIDSIDFSKVRRKEVV